jgi:hypothetical protein
LHCIRSGGSRQHSSVQVHVLRLLVTSQGSGLSLSKTQGKIQSSFHHRHALWIDEVGKITLNCPIENTTVNTLAVTSSPPNIYPPPTTEEETTENFSIIAILPPPPQDNSSKLVEQQVIELPKPRKGNLSGSCLDTGGYCVEEGGERKVDLCRSNMTDGVDRGWLRRQHYGRSGNS